MEGAGGLPTSQRFAIRPATLRDIDVLVHQRRGMWRDMGVGDKRSLDRADILYRQWARKSLRSGEFRAWLAENSEGKILGGGALWLQPVQPRPGYERGVQPYLLSMYTEKASRGKGVASRIVREAVSWTRKKGYPSLRLHASEMGRGVYSNLGFRRSWEMKMEFRQRKLSRP